MDNAYLNEGSHQSPYGTQRALHSNWNDVLHKHLQSAKHQNQNAATAIQKIMILQFIAGIPKMFFFFKG